MSNPRLLLNTLFRRGLDNQQQPRNTVFVQKCIERPSQPSRIEFFEPISPPPESIQVTPSSSPPGASLKSSFPFFQNRKETCFNRANLFMPTHRPQLTASSPSFFSLPPTISIPTPESNSGNNENKKSDKSDNNDSAKNKLKRSLTAAGLFFSCCHNCRGKRRGRYKWFREVYFLSNLLYQEG